MRHLCSTIGVAAVAAVLAIPVATAFPATAAAASPAAAWDFNGDGYADLVVGVPWEDGESGAVQVLYGSATGVSATGDDYWTELVIGTEDDWQNFSHLGFTLSSADYDGDGRADLAIGVPDMNVGSTTSSGAVEVLYGSATGLGVGRHVRLTMPGLGIDTVTRGVGLALASGDLDCDGHQDLAIAAPGTLVAVVHGGVGGLATDAADILDQASTAPGIPPTGEGGASEEYGAALASGDIDGDGCGDLAIAIPGATVSDVQGAGVVNVVYGSATHPLADGAEVWSQDSPGILDQAERWHSSEDEDRPEAFGTTIALGDFDNDGADDLAVGMPTEQNDRRGAVSVVYGSTDGLTADGNQQWMLSSPGVPGAESSDNEFGWAVAAGDLDHDGRDDLAIGVPGYRSSTGSYAGAVVVLYGSGSGLSATGATKLSQATDGVAGSPETGDGFGSSLAIANYGKSRSEDLVVGVPDEDIAGHSDAGLVQVLYGRLAGVSGSGSQTWHQDTAGVRGTVESNDLFGITLGR